MTAPRVLAAAVLVLGLAFAPAGSDARAPGPIDATNRWSSIDPAAAGFDAAALARADRYAARQIPNLTSLLVARRGRLVLERYYHGGGQVDETHVFSVTKSVISALVGIALRDGKLSSVDQRLAAFVEIPARADRRFRSVTLRDLLTMTSGLRLDGTDSYAGGAAYATADNWVRRILAQPFARAPGTTFVYDNRGPHLLSAVLSNATGMPAADLARRELFPQLGIPGDRVWSGDPQGLTNGSWGLSLTSRDLAKLGQLYLRDGRWRGRQLLPAAYVRASTRSQISTGAPGSGYGYLWWTRDAHDRVPAEFGAFGLGGQVVAVYRAVDLVVVLTSGGSTQPGAEYEELLYRLIIGALRR